MNPNTYYARNRERILAKMREKYRANPEAHNARCMASRDPEKYRAYQAKYKKEHCGEIQTFQKGYMKQWRDSDSGIARRLCDGTHLRPEQIPQELVDLKRAHLQPNRELMESE